MLDVEELCYRNLRLREQSESEKYSSADFSLVVLRLGFESGLGLDLGLVVACGFKVS